jgi:hypothetical protein
MKMSILAHDTVGEAVGFPWDDNVVPYRNHKPISSRTYLTGGLPKEMT